MSTDLQERAARRTEALRRAVWWTRPVDLLLPVMAASVAWWVAPPEISAASALTMALFTAAIRYVLGATFLSRDVPRALHAAEKAEQRAPVDEDALLTRLPIPMMIVDADSTVRAATAQSFDVLSRDVVGEHITSVFRASVLIEAVDDALSFGIDAELEFTVRRPQERMLSAHVTPLNPDARRADRKAIIVLQDVTRQHRSEATRMDFVANASHELRTPLASIGGFVETLLGPARDDEAARERFLKIIAREVSRMTRLVNDLLSLSRIEVEENVAPTEEQDLRAILGEVAATLRPLIEQQGVELTLDVADDLPLIFGFHDELSQVLVNLLENAVKYGGGAPVTVQVQSLNRGDAPGISVTVIDKGPGIDRSLIPRLTERFFRVDIGESRTLGGTGLGLAIVKHIVSRHRGLLEIRSEKGQGSTFALWFPAIDDTQDVLS